MTPRAVGLLRALGGLALGISVTTLMADGWHPLRVILGAIGLAAIHLPPTDRDQS